MQRGKKILFNPIVSNLVIEIDKIGRNTGIEARRDAMAYRYYFHATINRYLYKDCLFYLSQEFYLQPNTIIKELLLRVNLINKLTINETSTAELRKKYPFYNWVSKLL